MASRAVAAPKMRIPTAGVSTPSMRLMACPERTVPVEANPTYIRMTSASGITARAPSTMAVICALAPNHSVNWPLGWPWRSPGGIISMDRASTAVLPGPRLLAEKLHVGDKFDVRQHGLRSSLPVLCAHGVGDFPV